MNVLSIRFCAFIMSNIMYTPLVRTMAATGGMGFFGKLVDGLQIVVGALGAGLAIWGAINLLEGYGSDNPGAKSQGIKQIMAGGGVIILAILVLPELKTVLNF